MINSLNAFPNIIVIMKTYNGSKYVIEQVDSIMNQKEVNTYLYISDDGSNDDTISKIYSLKTKYKNIFLIANHEGEGPAMGFLNLVKYVVDNVQISDYFIAYADQDDVWYSDKLITAVTNLNEQEADLFLSTYDVSSSKQSFVRDMRYDIPITVERVLTYWCPSGNVFVFNKPLALAVASTNPKTLRMHDFWTLLVAISGDYKIVTLNKPLLMYRLHENNTVGLNKIGLSYFKNLFFSVKNNRNIRSLQATELLKQESEIIKNEEVREKIEKFSQYQYHLSQRVELSQLKILGMNNLQKVLFKVSTLLGVF